MEMLVHLESPDILRRYIIIPVTFDMRQCHMLDTESLPPEWASAEYLVHTRDIGADWLNRNESLVLGVPSAVIPIESNFLINPRHPDFGKLVIGEVREFRYDHRILKHDE